MAKNNLEQELARYEKKLAAFTALHGAACEFLSEKSMTLPDYLRLCRKTKAVTGLARIEKLLGE